MTIKEIEERKKELKEKILNASSEEELKELREEAEELEKEVPEEEEKEPAPAGEEEKPVEEEEKEVAKEEVATPEEERKLIRVGAEEIVPIGNLKEERNMEKKYTRASEEYRSAWAKTLMGVELDEEEKRALGDAVGTTATTFTASTSGVQGINNVGLFIPTSIILALNERAENESPIWRDIRKYNVNGNVTVPFLDEADDAKFYAELTATDNEGQKFVGLTLTGKELAKNIELTWKADQMTVDGFVNFIYDELYEKMFKAKINSIIYGNPSNNEPTGLTNGLTAVTTGDTPIDNIANTKATLSADAKKGARVYISSAVADAIRYYKNQQGNYPYLVGLPAGVEEDPFLTNNDIVVGNMRNYVWNEQEDMRLDRDINMKGRTVIYGAYQVVDGAPKTNHFALGQYTPSV